MTPTLDAYLEWIAEYRELHGRQPTSWQIAERFGVAVNTARKRVGELVQLDLLPRRRRGRPCGAPSRPPALKPIRAALAPRGSCSVMLSRPHRAYDLHIGSFATHDEARARARALNDELNAAEGIPRHDGGPFAFYYVVGRYAGMPAELADRLDAEAEAREAS